MTMQATVLSVSRDRLLVFDLRSRQRVVVITPNARRFRRGDFVCILFSGIMTNSIPPQISATSIVSLPRLGPWGGSCRF